MRTKYHVYLSKNFIPKLRWLWSTVVPKTDVLLENDNDATKIFKESESLFRILKTMNNNIITDSPELCNRNSFVIGDKSKASFEQLLHTAIAKRGDFIVPKYRENLDVHQNNAGEKRIVMLLVSDRGLYRLPDKSESIIYTENDLRDYYLCKQNIKKGRNFSPSMEELNEIRPKTKSLYIFDQYIFEDSGNRRARFPKIPNIISFFRMFKVHSGISMKIKILTSYRDAINPDIIEQKIAQIKAYAERGNDEITVTMTKKYSSYFGAERYILTDYHRIENTHPFDRYNETSVVFLPNDSSSRNMMNDVIKKYQEIINSQEGREHTRVFKNPNENI
jgi:hypothetical protein